jgi:hypothetical protein
MYTQEDFESIQECYRYVFPEINEQLERLWYPPSNYDWLCLTSRFDGSGPDYKCFESLGNDLMRVNRNQPPAVVGPLLAGLARKHRVGYSIGLNPWADFLFLQREKIIPKEIIIIVAHNWYPLVTSTGECPDPPLNRRDPSATMNGRYAFVFEPFKERGNPLLMFFTNIFPHFLEAGKKTNAGLSVEERNFIGGNQGMKNGLTLTLEAISPLIKIRGIVALGTPVWNVLSSQVCSFSGMNLSNIVKQLRNRLKEDPTNIKNSLPMLLTKRGNIPWLPYYHPSAFEMYAWAGWEERRADYSKLALALLSATDPS